MARKHGRIHTDAWRDEDWTRLTADAQRLYMLLLSQPKLSLCGTLDINVGRWSRMASDTTRESVEKALSELRDAWFVTVDDETEELAIRTFAKHDLAATRWNKNLAIGMWRAWEGIESELLRVSFVEGIPGELWTDWLAEHAPPMAVAMREKVAR